VNLDDGTLLQGLPDAYSRFILDTSTGERWHQMTNAERLASAERTGQVVWDGTAVTARVPAVLRSGRARVVSPPAIAGERTVGIAGFGPRLTTAGLTAPVVLADDGQGTASDACSPLVNAAAMAGKIALIDRGNCTFAEKVAAAEAAGALAAVIVNNQAGTPPDLIASSDPGIGIPAVSITQTDGAAIRALLGGGVTMTLDVDPAVPPRGADAAGRAMLYAPSPIAVGSSISHFDVSAFPNLLMEPFANLDLGSGVDLTLDLFADLGWFGIGTPAPTVRLESPIPNPFAAATRLDFEVDTEGEVDVSMYDLQGRLVKRLLHEVRPAGTGQASWDGRDEDGRQMRPGVYLCRVKLGDATQARRVVLMP
jgi:hypothetical protein